MTDAALLLTEPKEGILEEFEYALPDSFGPQRKLRVKPLLFGFAGALLLLFLVILLGVGVLVLATSYDSSDCPTSASHPPKKQRDAIQYTKEYQIQLESVELWKPRLQMVEIWLQSINAASEYLSLTMEDLVESPHYQYLLDASNCTSANEHYRVRNFTTGVQTVGLKGNAPSKKAAESFRYWPGSTFLDISHQKVENDVHTCSDKYSRETRLSFPTINEYLYCVDLVVMFPWNFDIPNDSLLLQLSQHHYQYWWLGKISGYMDDMKYEIEFTLQYDTADGMLLESENPTYGEWSIRTFAENDGFSETWNTEADTDAANVWRALQQQFGNSEYDDKACL